MTSRQQQWNDSIEILMGELMADDELRGAFLRNPQRTLDGAGDWGLPLSDSELRALQGAAHRVWETVVDELESQLAIAA